MIKPSEMLEFKEALSGGRGEFDAWLEVRDEAECREFIKQAIRDALEEAAKKCESIARDDYGMAYLLEYGECAAAIRKIKEDIQ